MRIDNEAGELRTTLRSSAGCSVVVTFLFAAASLAVCGISLGVWFWMWETLHGRVPPAIINQYSEQFPWHGHVDGRALVVISIWTVMWLWFAYGIGLALLRQLFGSDVIAAGSDLSVTKRIGPFGRTRSFALQSIRTFDIYRKGNTLIVRLDDGSWTELTASGTAKERMQLRDLLRERIRPVPSSAIPALTAHFEELVQPDGTHVVRLAAKSRRQLVGCTATIAALWLAATVWHMFRGGRADFADPMLVVAVLLFVLLVFVSRAEQSWQVKKGWFAYVRSFGPYRARSEYDSANFSVEERRDSDGDLWFTLYAERDGKKENLHSALNDAEDVVSLGRFLGRESGFPFYGLREE
jgi:hypothetical protein